MIPQKIYIIHNLPVLSKTIIITILTLITGEFRQDL